MAIRSLGDINAAFDAGRWHLQRFLKNAGTAHALEWADASFASGQPAYDARVGAALTFAPAVASGNNAIYFPGMAAGQERYLVSAVFRQAQTAYTGPGSVILFDLLGYYPLIDGDSGDLQEMDNTRALPRYTDGKGVVAVLVNHIAPGTAPGVTTINYVDSDGVARSAAVAVPNLGATLVVSGSSDTALTGFGSVNLPLPGGQGVKQITSVQHSTPPGGLHVIYLIKILGTVVLGDNLVATEKEFSVQNGFNMPRIYDGAWLGWFDRTGSGAVKTVAWYGHFMFAWG